ncbi:MAG: chemotaxis protein CheA [Beijerinckiaceae bacterium]|nr:chemotaxis protein CheA [Beijerinckiaceae bacterium]
MDDLFEQFLIESRELTQRATEDLMALERNPADSTSLASAFRAVHTLKGSVALFDFLPMGEVLHAAEDLLGALRDGRLGFEMDVIDALLDCIGASETWIDEIAQSGQLGPGADVRSRALRTALRAPLQQAADKAPAADASSSSNWLSALLTREAAVVARARAARRQLTAVRYTPKADCFFLGDDPLALVRSIPALVRLAIVPREPWDTLLDPYECNLIIEALSAAPVDKIQPIFRFIAGQAEFAALSEEPGSGPGQQAEPERPAPGANPDGNTIRVDASRIDALVDIASELAVAKNTLGHLVEQARESEFSLARAIAANHADIERLVARLHRTVMSVRMVPLAKTFRRFPRTVREIAAKLGKAVTFELTGDTVEADRAIVDGLFEPLLHVLRNALDHGIEPSSIRLAAGKPASGHVVLGARREGGRIIVTVADDGAGIDPGKIRATARARAIIDESALAAMDDAAVLDMIFRAGFSTASDVSDISGRGVGMDAVRQSVLALGGRVAVTSVPRAGSTISLNLPEAVTITTIVTVLAGDQAFGIPVEAIAEMIRFDSARISPVGASEAFALRDQTIPLLRLATLLGLEASARQTSDAKVLIAKLGDQRIAIGVDDFGGRFDVMLRPAPALLSGMTIILGTAVLGDGKVVMVLDLAELIG